MKRTVMIDFKMCCLQVVLVLPGSVETQFGWSGKFLLTFVEYSFLFPLVQKYKNRPRKARVKVKNKVARFYGSRCMCVCVFIGCFEFGCHYQCNLRNDLLCAKWYVEVCSLCRDILYSKSTLLPMFSCYFVDNCWHFCCFYSLERHLSLPHLRRQLCHRVLLYRKLR